MRKVAPEDLEYFDLVLAMDRSNLELLRKLCPANRLHRLKLFMSYARQFDDDEVPDPYYGLAHDFDLVLDMIEDAAEGLLDSILRERGDKESAKPDEYLSGQQRESKLSHSFAATAIKKPRPSAVSYWANPADYSLRVSTICSGSSTTTGLTRGARGSRTGFSAVSAADASAFAWIGFHHLQANSFQRNRCRYHWGRLWCGGYHRGWCRFNWRYRCDNGCQCWRRGRTTAVRFQRPKRLAPFPE